MNGARLLSYFYPERGVIFSTFFISGHSEKLLPSPKLYPTGTRGKHSAHTQSGVAVPPGPERQVSGASDCDALQFAWYISQEA